MNVNLGIALREPLQDESVSLLVERINIATLMSSLVFAEMSMVIVMVGKMTDVKLIY
jgi:hypothetical protein